MTTENIIASLLTAGHQVTYAEAPGTGGWFADLRDRSGRCAETGMGATQPEALAHLAQRLERDELAGMLGVLLGEDCSVTFGRDAADGSYFADVVTTAGAERSGSGSTPAAALREAAEAADEEDLQPYCKTCGEPVSIFIGYEGWHHYRYRGKGTAESRTELYDAGHAPVVAWRWPGER